MNTKLTYLALLCFGIAKSSVLPAEKCTLTDKECLIPAFQKTVTYFTEGLPEYNVEVLDPLAMDDVKIDIAGFKINITECTFSGLKTSIIDDVTWNLKKNVFTIDFHTDAVVKSNYIAAGRLLDLPISGNGDLKVKIKNLKFKVNIYYKIVKIDNEDHVKLTKYTFEYEVIDHFHAHLSNLFDGDKELSKTMLSLINNNWKPLSSLFGGPFIDSLVKKIYDNIDKLFENVPFGDIANI